MTDRIALTKLHGLGNDFLVFTATEDGGGAEPADLSAFARRVCDRHRGVGADGLLCATPGAETGTWNMSLLNADGSPAEMSGNGIRCFAQAVIRATSTELPTTLEVHTAAGLRVVQVAADRGGDPDTVVASVAMGRPGPGPELPVAGRPDTRPVSRTATWDLGNPHLVLEVDDPADVDAAIEGPAWAALFPDGINVHFIVVTGTDEIRQRTWERGAGVTQACGTGATAAALSAHDWGATSDDVGVRMPGGRVRVELGGEPVLHGPSQWIADVQVRR